MGPRRAGAPCPCRSRGARSALDVPRRWPRPWGGPSRLWPASRVPCRVAAPTASPRRDRLTRNRFSPVRSGNSVEERSQAIVATSEAELLRPLPKLHVCGDGVDVLPRNPDCAAATQPAEEPADEPGPLPPDARAAQQRADLQRLARIALELEGVHVAAAPPLPVEELVIDEVPADVDRLAQFWPTLVRIIRGIADSETTRMTTR